jgi:hypothetical protein
LGELPFVQVPSLPMARRYPHRRKAKGVADATGELRLFAGLGTPKSMQEVCLMVASDLLSIHEVSKTLNVPERTVRHWARTQVIAGFKPAKKKWVFHPADVERAKRRLGRSRNGGGQ